MMLTILLPWPPTANNIFPSIREGSGKQRRVLSKTALAYRRQVGLHVLEQAIPVRKLTGRLKVRIDAFVPDLRARDLGNIEKAPMDALVACEVIRDDCDIDHLELVRQSVMAGGKLVISISELGARP